ncbi:MAG: trimeric intracellular cation channel family protein [Clostridiales bacterium]|nr:trimeric intracellular cation channel family protein [Clostridiales bacterium]
MIPELVFFLIDLFGSAAFALSGAMVACQKKADLFGVIFLAETTALGGGMIRDVLLGRFPPAMFTNWQDLNVALVMALVVFFAVLRHSETYYREEELVERVNNLVDAVGLGMFAVTGCQVAISAGYQSNGFLVVFMGTVTAVGGGLLRDIILVEIPFILTKYIYALAAITGATTYYLLDLWGTDTSLAAVVGICVTFVLRWLATKYHWNLPRPA